MRNTVRHWASISNIVSVTSLKVRFTNQPTEPKHNEGKTHLENLLDEDWMEASDAFAIGRRAEATVDRGNAAWRVAYLWKPH
jgi:hypothetical protein